MEEVDKKVLLCLAYACEVLGIGPSRKLSDLDLGTQLEVIGFLLGARKFFKEDLEGKENGEK